jgi:hypothetical protein
MQPMEYPVQHGRQEQARDHKDHEAAVKSVDAGEELTTPGDGLFTGPIPPSSMDALRKASIQLKRSSTW